MSESTQLTRRKRHMLAGLRSVVDSLRWRPEKGNRIVLMPRAGGDPLYFEAEGAFMWHALNVFERGDEIIADIVAYDNPDHFIGDGPIARIWLEHSVPLSFHGWWQESA